MKQLTFAYGHRDTDGRPKTWAQFMALARAMRGIKGSFYQGRTE